MKRWCNNKGQSIVEIGLITPLLLVALYIPIDFGIALFTAHITQNAVREAVRIGAAKPPTFDNGTATAVKTEATSRLPARLTGSSVTVQYFWDGVANPSCMQVVQVSATGTYDYFFYQILRLLGGSVNDTLPITRVAQMRYDYQPSDNNVPACTTVAASA
jgi:Flp pilus assembly protein TadG